MNIVIVMRFFRNFILLIAYQLWLPYLFGQLSWVSLQIYMWCESLLLSHGTKANIPNNSSPDCSFVVGPAVLCNHHMKIMRLVHHIFCYIMHTSNYAIFNQRGGYKQLIWLHSCRLGNMSYYTNISWSLLTMLGKTSVSWNSKRGVTTYKYPLSLSTRHHLLVHKRQFI